MVCIYCETKQPEKGFFCPGCFKQVKCKHCNEELLKDAKICVYCGEHLGHKPAAPITNTIEFSETEKERKFKASFTDTVGQSISDSFGRILTSRIGTNKSLPPSSEPPKETDTPTETIDTEAEVIPDQAVSPKKQNTSIPSLKEIKLRDLAKSDTDWLLVYSYMASGGGTKEFTRENIIQLYKDSDRRTDKRIKALSQLFKNISKALYIKSTNDSDFILLDKGKARVLEIFSGNSKAKVSKSSAGKPSESKAYQTSKNNNKTAIAITFLTELNLRPKGKESFKDFVANYNIKTSEELNLLIIYYLKDVLNEKVTLSHIYTCLKDLGKKIPTHLKQVLINNKNKKNWINLADWDDIKFTTAGMNYIEHDLIKTK
jgi:hypothetical protein